MTNPRLPGQPLPVTRELKRYLLTLVVGVVVLLVLLAILVGGVGLAVEGMLWLLVIAAALVIAGAVMGLGARSSA